MSKRIEYQNKTNAIAVVDRTKQATAEDFNDIKDVVNTNAEELDQKPNYADIPPVVANLTTVADSIALAASQGVILKQAIDNILVMLQSDDVDLDKLQELVDYIKQNREDLQNLSYQNISGLQTVLNNLQMAIDSNTIVINQKPNFSDLPTVVANLTTNSNTAALAASQGVILKQAIDNILVLLQSDDVDLDELQELVDYIKQNREELQNLSWNNISGLPDQLTSIRDIIANLNFEQITDQGNTTSSNINTQLIQSSGKREDESGIVRIGDYDDSSTGAHLLVHIQNEIIEAANGSFKGRAINIGSGFFGNLSAFGLTATRSWKLPNKSGTVALIGYKVYTAIITQSGTNNPTVVVLENTLGYEPTLSRIATGLFTITPTTDFDVEKTAIFLQNQNGTSETDIVKGIVTADLIQLSVHNGANVLKDGFSQLIIEIRIYP